MVGGVSDRNNCYTPQMKENHLVAVPVVAGSTGVGLPYAPEDWPCPGDRWGWKVGSRKRGSGHWVDRCVFLPPTCSPSGKKKVFHSKKSLEAYIRKEFPCVDVSAFFSSFIWRVPSADFTPQKGSQNNKHKNTSSRNSDINKQAGPGKDIKHGDCKAGNMTCNLLAKEKNDAFATKDCDICCSETDFCRDCCCILCSKTVDWANGRCGFIICEAKLDDYHICGHVAHLDCALRSYMAGTVGGSIGLDVEYYCRRCDNKTDLMPHVAKLFKSCESLDSREDVEKFLNLGFVILRGSKQERANNLQYNVGVAIDKLKHGLHIDEVWKVEENSTTPPAGNIHHNGHEIVLGTVEEAEEDCNEEAKPMAIIEEADGRAMKALSMTSDYNGLSAKLEGDIDQVLHELKRSQEKEFRIAEQKLCIQKDFLLSLYQQLYYERSLLANPAPPSVGGDSDALLSNVLHRVDQIKYEEEKLRKMMDVGRGFGRDPKCVITEHYELDLTS